MRERRALVVLSLVGLLALCAALMMPSVAVAHVPATLTVNSLLDNGPGDCTSTCTLRDAVASSSSGDTINFSVMGTITLNGTAIYIDHDLTIDGPGARLLTVSANGQSRVIDTRGPEVTVSGLTMADGNPNSNDENSLIGGGILNWNTLNLSNVTMKGSSSAVEGGAVENYGVLNVADSTFTGNGSTFGAAISNHGTANIAASTFTASSSGYSTVVAVAGTTYITNSTFSGNGNQPVAAQATVDITNSILNDSFCDGFHDWLQQPGAGFLSWQHRYSDRPGHDLGEQWWSDRHVQSGRNQ